MIRIEEGAESPLITHIVGARPNFPKAAPVIRALKSTQATQRLVHTGQHYDDALSEAFFRDLDLPRSDTNLGVRSGTHALQTAALLTAIETEVTSTRPTLLMVYGDVNSTLAAALVASKLGIHLAHVEAGLRSYDRSMPEEINRVVTDQLSDLLFTTSPEAADNLAREGIHEAKVHFVGNPMIDTLLTNWDKFKPEVLLQRHALEGDYAVATLHRPANVDDPETAATVVTALERASQLIRIVLPLHPRGLASLKQQGLGDLANVDIVDPLGYLDFISLVRGSRAVITDSGGVQEETTMLGIPCLTMRPNTERPVTISQGTNRLVNPSNLPNVLGDVLSRQVTLPDQLPPLWDGKAGTRISAVIRDWIQWL